MYQSIICLESLLISMTNQANVKLYAYKSRHSINLPTDFVRDSAFPFEIGEELVARIEEGKVVIEKKSM
ncbi:MAG: hypothetical protein A4E51_01446 [Methanosaeta sp. PtaU1.Bin055]|nr:MAG: hypothetical protein A4E51_01446 [Methanosaeta sp. PtaU1.Bin055]